MIKLLILADDLTGAIDTGVQFTAHGIDTVVLHEMLSSPFLTPAQVLVINTQTRNADAQEAYQTLLHIAGLAKAHGIEKIFKKTDSGLRGNVGAELQAVLDVFGGALAFAPAHPSVGRHVVNGRLTIDGVPVTQSIYGRDPFKPVLHDDIALLLQEQANSPVTSPGHKPSLKQPHILLYEGRSLDDMDAAAADSCQRGIKLFAGCAGFAESLIPQLHLPHAPKADARVKLPLFVVSGSVSEVSFRQIKCALASGWVRARIDHRLLLSPSILKEDTGQELLQNLYQRIHRGEKLIITSAISGDEALSVRNDGNEHGLSIEELKSRISANLGYLCAEIARLMPEATPAIFGGDTLHNTLSFMQTSYIRPLFEIEKGTVVSNVLTMFGDKIIISKSGSLGEEDSIEKMFCFTNGHSMYQQAAHL